MNQTTAERYRARFRKVLEHIDAHPDDELSVEKLGRLAAFSKYHFHRQFSKLFGIGVYRYVQLCRLKRAAYQLAFRRGRPIVDIALACGYEGPESFARVFRKHFEQSPSEFRKEPRWRPWHAIYQPLTELRRKHMKAERQVGQVKIVQFHETRVAAFEHRGDPQLIGDSLRKFIEWRKRNRLPPSVAATFNILYDDPARVAPEDYRFDLCVATDRAVADNAFGIVGKTIPGGRCALLRHIGSDDTLGDAVRYLYRQWLPKSGEERREFPAFLQRVRFFPDVPEGEAVTDVFLPLR